ncbi:MAG: polysaccharide pyruvyl transferase family protein [Acidimicrobiales bacterium]
MSFIKQLILQSAIMAAWIINNITPRKKFVYSLAPGPAGSIGDEAIIAGLFNLLEAKNPGVRIRQVVFPGWDSLDCPGADKKVITAGVIWGTLATLHFIFAMLSCRHFTVIGADVLDGKYSSDQVVNTVMLCNLAAKIGVPVTILGFSFCEDPNPIAVASLRELDPRVICFCRDAISLERFQRMTQHSAELAADLAFNMKPNLEAPSAVKAAQWIKGHRVNGARIIGLNANVLTVAGTDIDIFQSYANELTKILDENADVVCVMLPHDLRKGQSDYESLKSIAGRMHESYKSRIHLLAPPYNAWDVKALAGILDLVISGRLHLIIGALAQSVPSIGITYQGKFEGVFNYFDCPELLFDPSGLSSHGQLANFVSNILPKLDSYKTKITKALPKVLELSARNTKHI